MFHVRLDAATPTRYDVTAMALELIGKNLHQDIGCCANDVDDLARYVLDSLSVEERAKLCAYLAVALNRLTPSELKGRLNRTCAAHYFTSKGAEQFLRSIFALLQADGR